MAAPLAMFNGRMMPYADAAVPLHDAGFVLGATATDLVRTFRHRLFRLDDHLARFRQSCELCRIPLEAGDGQLRRSAEELIEQNARLIAPGADLGLVMFATPGPVGFYGGLGGGAGDGPPTWGMHTFPLPFDRYRRLFTEGARLVIPPLRRSDGIDPRAKQRSRMQWWLAGRLARDVDTAADALLLDADGSVTETASANLVAVRGDELLTPPAGGVLDGVSLKVVCELAGRLGLTVREARLTPRDCATADELLLTCTTWCLAGVSRLDGRPVPWPGPVYRRLLRAYSDYAGTDVERQALG
jgi:branched-chain amino acid aminotransferase